VKVDSYVVYGKELN